MEVKLSKPEVKFLVKKLSDSLRVTKNAINRRALVRIINKLNKAASETASK